MLVPNPNASKGRSSQIGRSFDLVYWTHLFWSSAFQNVLKYCSASEGGAFTSPFYDIVIIHLKKNQYESPV